MNALRGAPITRGSREVHSQNFWRSRIICSADPAMAPGAAQKQKMESNMLNKLLVAAAMAAVAYATCPANAAKVSAGCGGGNLTKAESQIEAMADGEGKMVAQKEVAAAQEAMLNGKMGACAAHLSKAMQASTAK
jgi:hypothetical protein